MPSRRQILDTIAASVPLTAGCSRLKTDSSDTTTTETGRRTSDLAQSPSTSETRAKSQNTERDSRCSGSWDSNPVWSFDSQQSVESVVAGGEFAFAVGNESVTALDPDTGRVQWTVSGDDSWGTLEGASFETDGLLVVVASRNVVAIDTATESVRWSYTIPGREQTAVVSDAAVHAGTLYVGAVNAATPSFEPRDPYTRILAIDLETGDHRTFVDVSADQRLPTLYSLNADENGVYADLDGELVAYGSDAGVQWRTAVSPVSEPDLAEATLVVPTETGLVGVETSSGSRRWTKRLASRKIVIENETVYVSVHSRTQNGLSAVDTRTGTVEWETTTTGRGGGPVVRDGVVYLPVERQANPDRLGAFDSRSGCSIERLDFDSDGLYRISAGNERVFTVLGVSHGTLRAYEMPSQA